MKWRDRLVERFGSLRKAAAAIGEEEDHQRLAEIGPKQRQFLNRMRKTRKALKMSLSAFWGEVEKDLEDE